MDWVKHAAARGGNWLTAHKRWISGSFVTALAGSGIAAFAIAPLAPDASDLPQRLVNEFITPPDLASQLDALADHNLQLTRSDVSRVGDTADTLLRRLGIDDPEAVAFLRSDSTTRRLFDGRGGKMIQVMGDRSGRLVELVARYQANRSEQIATHFTRLSVARANGRWQAATETAPLETSVRLASGTIRSTFFAATDEARLPDGVAAQMADIFAPDVDFHRELKRGDTFSVAYEALTADGEPIVWNQAAGRVLAAELVNRGRTHTAVWFRDESGKDGYFDYSGRSKKRSFLASPMEFSRVTSGFAMRMHPIHQTWRQHLGVDYAAPIGTPVRNVGDGVVTFAGVQNGYGNVVMVDHGGGRSTTYAHLSSIDVKQGQRVEQGQHLGAVGATGWATGPHLHFEFRIDGVHQDPLQMARDADPNALNSASGKQFVLRTEGAKAQLLAAQTVRGIQAE